MSTIPKNIGIRLHDTIDGSFTEKLDFIKGQGFSCIHLALSKAYPDTKVTDASLTPGFAQKIRRELDDRGLDLAVLGCYLNLLNPDPEELKAVQAKYRAHIRFASMLGGGVVGTETGCPNREYKACEESYTEETLQKFIENLKPVIADAEKMGVIFAIEPVWRHCVNTPERARKVLDAIDSPNLQIIFDPVNLIGDVNYERAPQIIHEAIELLWKDVVVLHIKDYEVKDGKVVPAQLGKGLMDYTEIMENVKKDKPYVQMSLEETTPANAREGRLLIAGM